MGSEAARTLLKRIQETGASPQRVTLPVEIVLRESA
jgi:DNA-binding LacI/PurR family transcriptional regulator